MSVGHARRKAGGRTWMLAVQRVVIALILEPETPGGLRLSMDCRIESSSATADDISKRSCLQVLQEFGLGRQQ